MNRRHLALYVEALREMESGRQHSLGASLTAARLARFISRRTKDQATRKIDVWFNNARFCSGCEHEHKMLMLGFAAAIERSGGL